MTLTQTLVIIHLSFALAITLGLIAFALDGRLPFRVRSFFVFTAAAFGAATALGLLLARFAPHALEHSANVRVMWALVVVIAGVTGRAAALKFKPWEPE